MQAAGCRNDTFTAGDAGIAGRLCILSFLALSGTGRQLRVQTCGTCCRMVLAYMCFQRSRCWHCDLFLHVFVCSPASVGYKCDAGMLFNCPEGAVAQTQVMRHLLPHGPAVKIFIFLSDGNRFPEVSVIDNKKNPPQVSP